MTKGPPGAPAPPIELPSDSQVARALDEIDFSQTPLGPPSEWPVELSAVVRAMLGSRFSMWMAWGPELTFFYNDAYARDTLARKHPWALGRPASEVWSEIWPEIGPRIDSVMQDGVATWDERLLLFLERSGAPEETYHTFSYSPLHGPGGLIEGMLCVVSEETDRVIGERRMSTLRTLAARLAVSRTEPEMVNAIRERLTENRHDLPFSLVYLYEAPGMARLSCAAGIPPGHPAAPELIDVGDPAAAWPAPAPGERTVLDDLGDRFAELPSGAWSEPPRQALVVPLGAQAEENPAGFVVAALNPFRPLDASYGGFVALLGGQVAAAIARARAYEREQERARALAALDRAKTEFFSNVSHELRTPLTLIMAPVDDALADRESPLPERHRERLEMVRRNARRLRRMVNDILDFSRIEREGATPILAPTDLSGFTRGLVASFAPAIERAGLELRESLSELDEPVLVDTQMWERIVLNLLSNALKFTLTGFIEVSLAQRDGQVELVVADSGIGIPEEAQPRLFERFYRVGETGGRSYEGSGIGLALVHELVALHGGTIGVESRLGEGSRFVVSIPYEQAPGGAVAQVAPSAAASSYRDEAMSWGEDVLDEAPLDALDEASLDTGDEAGGEGAATSTAGASVLVVDDNADLRAMLSRLLSPRYEVRTAVDGEEALRLVSERAPDLVLTDVMMPRVDGLELLRELRADPATASLPVILLSARAGEEAAIGGLRAGADDYLVKPFSARELVARVRSSLELAAVRQEASAALTVERHRLEQTLAQLPMGVLMAEAPSGRIVLANERVERILGHPVDAEMNIAEVSRDRALTLDGGPLPADEYPLMRAVRFGETGRDVELIYRRGDDTEVVLRVDAAPIVGPDGEPFAAVSVFQDVTAEVRRRRLLMAHRDVLARIAEGQPLARTLEMLVELIEESAESDDAIASILLSSEDEAHLVSGAAPHLPDAYNEAIDGIEIGEGMGSCGTAAHRGEPVIVTDTQADPLWAEFRELAAEHGLRACWSTPITAADGKLMGTFAVYHRQVWTPTESEQQLVALMSQTAAVAIDRDRSARARARQFDEMQQGLRPRALEPVPGLDVAVRFRPGTRGLEVGGDFYDVFALDDGCWGFMIGDVCGHGAEAAAATAVARHTARAVALREPDPGAVLAAVDDALRRSDLGRFCTAVFGRIEPAPAGFALRMATGGHPPPLLLRPDGAPAFIRPHGPLLGVLPGPSQWPTVEVALGPGEALLTYTDGLIERNPRLPDEASFEALAASVFCGSAEEVLDRLEREAVGGRPPADDMALLLLRAL